MIGFLIAVFARHFSLLLMARVVQGFGISPRGYPRSISREKLVQALSFLIMAVSMPPMIGPFIGGHIQHRLGEQIAPILKWALCSAIINYCLDIPFEY